MPKGIYERKKVENTPSSDLKAHEQAIWLIAEILQQRCGIPGCSPKHHMEEANLLMRKFINLGIITEEWSELNETDLAWAAGFFDGEGSVQVVARKNGNKFQYFQLTINAPQINKEPLLKLQAMFHGQINPVKGLGTRRQSYTWTLHAAKAKDALNLMLPYLIVKRNEAELALQFQSTLSKYRRDLDEWDLAERQAVREALQTYHKTYVWEAGGSN